MATFVPTVEERDANLDALQQSVEEWAEQEENRLDKEAKFLRSVLQGRGASEVGTTNLSTVSLLLQASIDQFITGA